MILRVGVVIIGFCLGSIANAELPNLAAFTEFGGGTPSPLVTGYLLLTTPVDTNHRVAGYCRLHPTHKHCCYSAVKTALVDMGLVDHRLNGERARSAASELAKEGWKEKSCGARSEASVGMVCTFSGFTNGNGHAEVFRRCPGTNRLGWYYGASCKAEPTRKGCFSCKVPAESLIVARVEKLNLESRFSKGTRGGF